MYNLSVRHRLRNQLNVQLTDSNVIDQSFHHNNNHNNNSSRFISKIIQNGQQQNNQSSLESCDISLINDLNMLNSFMGENVINNDSSSYYSKELCLDNQQYNNDASSIYVSNQFSPKDKIRQRINTLNSQSNEYQSNLQQNNVMNSHIFKPTLIKQSIPQRINIINQQINKNITSFRRQNVRNNQSISDIQEKLNVLPYELQQKIKRNLHKKHSLNMLNQHQNSSLLLSKQLSNNQSIANEAVSFILPVRQDDKSLSNSLKNRQKFISVNRQTSHHKLSNSSKKSLLLLKERQRQINDEYRTKRQQYMMINNGDRGKRRTEKSLSREKYLLLTNSIKSPQSSSILMINNNTSKQKYHNTFNNNNNKNIITTNELVQKRKQQFAQFYKQTINNKQNQSHQKQLNIKNQHNSESTHKNNRKTQNYHTQKQNIIELQQLFNKSKVIKNYIEILSTVPKCKKCSTTYGALTLINNHSVIFSCNQCDLKYKLDRSVSFLSSSDYYQNSQNKIIIDKNCSQYNHPVIGVLFDLQNKLQNQQEMKTYNLLIKQINCQIQKINQKRQNLTILLNSIQSLKSKVQKNPKLIFEAKNQLKKFLINNQSQESKDLQNFLNISIPTFLPSQYLQELDLWCKINTKNFNQYPLIDSKLQELCPLYLKKYMKTMGQFINPLFYNFQTTNTRISVSQGLKLPVKYLGQATFVIDGPYNISPFQQVQKLILQFVNKRTFRQIASVMECLPQISESISLSYNHKLNSHISAQKYPILTKVVSLRSCKKLNVQILNCKDEDDLLNAFRVMTKKRQLKLQTTRSIYVRKPVTDCTQELKEMLKRLGKNICQIDLKLAAHFNESQIYKQLLITERNKLLNFKLISTINQSESPTKIDNQLQKFLQRDNLSSNQLEQLNYHCVEQYSAKKCFQNKIRKKLTAFVVLKQSFLEKQCLQSSKELLSKSLQLKEIQRNHKSKHLLRLEVLKMLM